MIKYAKIINQETKACEVGLGTNTAFYVSVGMSKMDVEQAYNGVWYVKGYAPQKPEPTYAQKRADKYPPLPDQLDMLYWDKVNGTTNWTDRIGAVKAQYPKPQGDA